MKSTSTLIFLLSFITSMSTLYASPSVADNHIKIDQFGYTCTAQKIAVISNPKTGYNSSSTFSPGIGVNNYEVRRWSDNVAVYSGTLTPWNAGGTHAQSGDQVWWFDFSSVTVSGNYYIYDVSKGVSSYVFDISDNIYENILKQAVRTYYYQRCGVNKTTASAGTGWADGTCHLGVNQDTDCRLYSSPNNIATSKDLSGGWHDAGDYNKYVNFSGGMLTDLLLGYEENPPVWTDDYSIPESGNSIPDILDEAKYELDWLLKMQQSDGSVLSIVGNLCSGTSGSTSPPSVDQNKRVYGPATTSATFTSASVFALGAIQFKNFPSMAGYVTTLQTAAENAWAWANANPKVVWKNNSNNLCNMVSGEQEVDSAETSFRKLNASVFLFKLTGNVIYQTYFDTYYNKAHLVAWGYAYPFEGTNQDVALYYTKIIGATPATVTAIQNAYENSIKTNNADNLPSFTNNTDAYRAYLSNNNYTWGSNHSKCTQGNMFMNMNIYNLDAANAANYRNAASGFIHYIHGVNPTAFCYLTNMGNYGAENSISTIYHSWFTEGSATWDQVGVSTYGPPSGFMPGGPNPTYTVDGCCPSGCGSTANNAMCSVSLVTPPLGQPHQKSYKDWNANWPQDSWAVTETSTGYQSSYIRLLSKFVNPGLCDATMLTTFLPLASPAITDWEVYPNPANDHLYIKKKNDGMELASITMYDSKGTSVYQNKISSTTPQEINIGNLPSGIYLIYFIGGEKTYVQKIVKP